MTKLWAISDVHVGYPANRAALLGIKARPNDWLILAGDVGETEEHLRYAFDVLGPKFKKLVWVPGNHELWTTDGDPCQLRGHERYLHWVQVCRAQGVLCPEDPYPVVDFCGQKVTVAPLFCLYDYSFRPPDISREAALGWARDEGLVCADEYYLHPAPYPTRDAWCHALVDAAQARLEALPKDARTVLINHFPLRADLVFIPRVPRFSIWCGTTRTTDWHRRFNAVAVVSGHLHFRSTRLRDGVRFEEVSLGYPKQWAASLGADAMVREILPGAALV